MFNKTFQNTSNAMNKGNSCLTEGSGVKSSNKVKREELIQKLKALQTAVSKPKLSQKKSNFTPLKFNEQVIPDGLLTERTKQRI